MKQRNTWKLFFWDVGGVRAGFRSDYFYEQLATSFETTPLQMAQFLNFCETPGSTNTWRRFELSMSPKDIYEEFVKHFRVHPLFENFIVLCNGAVEGNGHVRFSEIDEELYEAGVMQGFVSNMMSIHAEYTKVAYKHIFRHAKTDLCFFSCGLGMRKEPGSRIFKHIFQVCKETYGIEPRHIAFADDHEEHCRLFEKSGGGKAFWVRGSAHRLRLEMIRAGFPLPAEQRKNR